MRKNKKFVDPRYFMDEKMELNERILDFEELINTASVQVKDKTANIETLKRLIAALQQSQDPEQIKQLKILKNYVHHAVPESMPRGAARGERSQFTKAEIEMMQKYKDIEGDWRVSPDTQAWYANYINTGDVKA